MKWISVKEKMPKQNETVWICNQETGFVTIGSYVYFYNEGWFWVVTNGVIYSEEREIISECELDDDYNITHWQKLPKLPKSK